MQLNVRTLVVFVVACLAMLAPGEARAQGFGLRFWSVASRPAPAPSVVEIDGQLYRVTVRMERSLSQVGSIGIPPSPRHASVHVESIDGKIIPPSLIAHQITLLSADRPTWRSQLSDNMHFPVRRYPGLEITGVTRSPYRVEFRSAILPTDVSVGANASFRIEFRGDRRTHIVERPLIIMRAYMP
jgi:hypothetical protein